MIRRRTPIFILLLTFILISIIPPRSTFAAVQPCTEAGLDAAISAGDVQTFDCSVPTSFTISATKTIWRNVTLDGGGNLTISGGNVRQVFKVNAGITLTLKNLTVTGGYSDTDNGGAIKSNGAVVLDGVTISNNHSDYSGGAFYGGQITITNSTISNNSAGTTGGVYAWGSHVVVTNSTFSGNQHTALSQATHLPNSPVRLDISNSSFINNEGAALGVGGNTFLNVVGSTFTGNTNSYGGAISSWTNRTGNIANSTFSGNSASSAGGAVYQSYDTGQFNITNSTFYGNTAPNGGAIYVPSGTVTVQDSLFAASSGGDCVAEPVATINGSGNLSDGSCAGTLAAPTGIDMTLANNGGPTLTHKLLDGSNAINAGLTCKYRSGGTNPLFNDNTPLTVDQRGAARNTPCDIGAMEVVPPIIFKDSTLVVANGGSVEYPVRRTTDPANSKTFIIENWSTSAITLTPPGVYPPGCSLVSSLPTSIPPFSSAIFQVQCTSASIGEYSGAISFGTSVAEFNPFSFTVYHFVQAPGIVGVGTARSCTAAAFDLGMGDIVNGGTLTFNCGASPVTIVTSSAKTINTEAPFNNPRTIDGGGLVTLSGNHQHRLFSVIDPGDLILRNITLSNGYEASADGGAVFTQFGDLTLENVTITGSEANYGGGVSAQGWLTITDTTFSNNKANYSGGGVFVNEGSMLNISGAFFNGNTAQDSGGGIYTKATQSRVESSTFTNNQAVFDGGAYCHSCLDYAGGTKVLNISGSTFTGNIAGRSGGALYNGAAATITALDSTFASNRAGTGGAISNLNYQDTLNVANSTFSGNIGVNAGGAIYNNRDVYVSNVTFVGNTAPAGSGGGLYAWDWKTRVKNSLFVNNTGGDCAIGGGYTSFTGENNLSDATCSGSIGAPTLVDLTLANNGGLTQTHALRHRTNAYNAVPALKCTYLSGSWGNLLFNNGDPITTDQRGMARLGTCDIGAYEYYGPVITADPQDQTIVSGTTGSLSVTAEGPGTLAYQWYQGTAPDTDEPISGATNPTYTTEPLTADTPFWVRVTNEYDHADSYTATIWMNVPPQITAQPASQVVVQGKSAVLSVTATGTPPLTYQWYAGDSGDTSSPIDSATLNTFTTSLLYSAHHYWVRVSNAESRDSETATITVESALTAAPGRAYFTTPMVTLTWSGTQWASNYEVWVARDAAFTKLVHTSGELEGSRLSHGITLTENGVYFWKARARKPDGGWSSWSAVETFVLDLP